LADTTIEVKETRVNEGAGAVRRPAKRSRKRGKAKPAVKELLTTAENEARKMRAVNPAQYYRQNLGQLGFGDPEHALVQTIKELMDNSLDACEAMGILPVLEVKLTATEKQYEVITNKTKDGGIRRFPIFKIAVEDNGCGVIKSKVAKAFGKVLYGSKFFALKQSRGQQGLGVHAAIIYAQLTSLEPATITTKTEADEAANKIRLKIDTESNSPVIISTEEAAFPRAHGTRVELMVAGDYTGKVESFMKELSLANPHADLKFTVVVQPGQTPSVLHFKRANDILPPQAKEIKPHLLSMEPGALLEMRSNDLCCNNAKQFLVKHFVRISEDKAAQILKSARQNPNSPPQTMDVETLLKAARDSDLMRPPLDVLSPIGEDALRQSLKRMYPDSEFVGVVSREPWSYRGMPFQVEVGVVYGGPSVVLDCDKVREGVFKTRVIRLGNKCPLIYDSKDCLLYKVVKELNWRNYKIPQDEGSLPMAPMIVAVSLVSTKVPYIVAGKFAVAYHEEIREQLKLALQTLGRMIYAFISHRQRQEHEMHRQSIFQVYAREVAKDLSVLSGKNEQLLLERLLESSTHSKVQKKPSKGAPKVECQPEASKHAAPKAAKAPRGSPEPALAVVQAPKEAEPKPLPAAAPKKRQSTLEQFWGTPS